MLKLSTLKVKNTRDVIWLNKCYGEWKSIKGYSLHEFEVIKKPSSDTDSSDSVTNANKTMAEKDTSSDDSSDDEDEESDNLGNIADRTRAKLSQQGEDNLVINLNRMRISETAALLMQELVEWCLVGGEDADYTNPTTFNNTWNHVDENERIAWRDAIKKEINDMTKREVWRKTKKNLIPSN